MGGILGSIVSGSGVLGKVLGGAGGLGSLPGIGSVLSVLGAVNSAQDKFGGKEKSQQVPIAPAEAPPFSPVKPNELARPESLGAEFSAFSPEQQRSNLATKGLNSGLGADEDAYYRNLIQRTLIGDDNKVQTGNPNFLLPIESQYFSRQGKDTSDIMKFLQSISN